MDEILKNYFEILNESNRMSHAFLICNTKYDDIEKDLNNILSKYFFYDKNINTLLNDLIIIKPTNQKILKEDILSLKESMKLKSQYNQNKVYVICEAEKMNDYASNALLKFLEEPENDIYAFLITENINKVLPTIKSRCQILNIGNKIDFDINSFNNELVEKSIKMIELIENKSENAVGYLNDYIGKKEDRNVITDLLIIIKYFYKESFDYKIMKNNNCFLDYWNLVKKVSDKNTEKQLLNKIMIILSLENMLQYNMNVNLIIDKLIIELGMINHE